MVSACGSPTLLGLRTQLFDRSERYRSLSASRRPAVLDKAGEYRAIMIAAIARNADLAAELIERRIRATATNVLKYVGDLLEA